MKVKFGKLEVDMAPPSPEWKENYTARLPGGFGLTCYKSNYKCAPLGRKQWHAYMEGPWYEDSNPAAYADTAQEAISTLAERVIDLCYGFKDLREAIDDTLP